MLCCSVAECFSRELTVTDMTSGIKFAGCGCLRPCLAETRNPIQSFSGIQGDSTAAFLLSEFKRQMTVCLSSSRKGFKVSSE